MKIEKTRYLLLAVALSAAAGVAIASNLRHRKRSSLNELNELSTPA